MNETTIANLPVVAIWIIAVFQMFVALFVVGILAAFGGQIRSLLFDLREMVKDLHLETMPSVLESVQHVRTLSDEARRATQDIAGKVDRVATMVSSAATRAESPVVKGAGLLSGVVTASRFVRIEKRAEKAKQKAEYAKAKKMAKRQGKRGLLKGMS